MANAKDLVYFASDAAFAVNHELQVVAWNQHAEELLNYSEQEILGHPCGTVVRAVLPNGQPLCVPNCQAKLCFGRCQPYAARNCLGRRKDGQWVKMSLSSIALPKKADEDGITAVIFLQPFEVNPHSRPTSEAGLRLFTLGRFSMAIGDRGIPFYKWERKQALTLLKYLITYRGRAVHRERLIEFLWPATPEYQGRQRLKVIIYFLRREFQRTGIEEEIIETADEAYLLKREGIWADADVFEDLVREGHALEDREEIEKALRCYQEADELYRGDYLEENLYDDWAVEERERLREIYLDLFGRMAGLHAARGAFAQAAQVCRKALVREPCRESFHRALMEYLWRQGRRGEALAQFHHCKRVLAQALGVEPLPETYRLHQQILQSPRLVPSSKPAA